MSASLLNAFFHILAIRSCFDGFVLCYCRVSQPDAGLELIFLRVWGCRRILCRENLKRNPDSDDASSALHTWPVYTCHFLCLWGLMTHTSIYGHARTLQCSSMQCATNQSAFKAGEVDRPSFPVGKPKSLLPGWRCS